LRVYVASDLGFTHAGRSFYEGTLLPHLTGAGLSPLDPWEPAAREFAAAAAAPVASRDAALRAANASVGENNSRLILSSDAVLALVDGADVDSGVAAEIGYAAAVGRPVFAWRSDLRSGGDNDLVRINLQVEWFVNASGGAVFDSLDACVEALVRAAQGR
jgi:nucleoside 2-deoxyribosyltransferase